MPNQCFYCDNSGITKATVYDVDLQQTLIVDVCEKCLGALEDGVLNKNAD